MLFPTALYSGFFSILPLTFRLMQKLSVAYRGFLAALKPDFA